MSRKRLPRRSLERYGPVRSLPGPTAAPADRFEEAPPALTRKQVQRATRRIVSELDRRSEAEARPRRRLVKVVRTARRWARRGGS